MMLEEGGISNVKSIKQLKEQIRDYHRFIATLVIVSSYLYIGGIHDIYIQPSSEGRVLLILSLITASLSFIFMVRCRQLKRYLNSKK